MRIYMNSLCGVITEEEDLTTQAYFDERKRLDRRREFNTLFDVKALLLKIHDPQHGNFNMFHLYPEEVFKDAIDVLCPDRKMDIIADMDDNTGVQIKFIPIGDTDKTLAVYFKLQDAITREACDFRDAVNVSYNLTSSTKFDAMRKKKGIVPFKHYTLIPITVEIEGLDKTPVKVEGKIALNVLSEPYFAFIQLTYDNDIYEEQGLKNRIVFLGNCVRSDAIKLEMVSAYHGTVYRKKGNVIALGRGLTKSHDINKIDISQIPTPLHYVYLRDLSEDDLFKLTGYRDVTVRNIRASRLFRATDINYENLNDHIYMVCRADDNGQTMQISIRFDLYEGIELRTPSYYLPTSMIFRGHIFRTVSTVDEVPTEGRKEETVERIKPIYTDVYIGEFNISLIADNFTITLDYADPDLEVEQYNVNNERAIIQVPMKSRLE